MGFMLLNVKIQRWAAILLRSLYSNTPGGGNLLIISAQWVLVIPNRLSTHRGALDNHYIKTCQWTVRGEQPNRQPSVAGYNNKLMPINSMSYELRSGEDEEETGQQPPPTKWMRMRLPLVIW